MLEYTAPTPRDPKDPWRLSSRQLESIRACVPAYDISQIVSDEYEAEGAYGRIYKVTINTQEDATQPPCLQKFALKRLKVRARIRKAAPSRTCDTALYAPLYARAQANDLWLCLLSYVRRVTKCLTSLARLRSRPSCVTPIS